LNWRFDILSGVSGCLLALISLFHATQEPPILEKAILCGDHLLNCQKMYSSNSSIKSWKLEEEKYPLAGFSHGSAGVAYALCCLYDCAKQSRFLNAAYAGIEYERSLFSKSIGFWKDLRTSPNGHSLESVKNMSWCNGSSGIGIARLGSLDVIPHLEVSSDIDAALTATNCENLQLEDYLCCGNFGRAELFTIAYQKFREPKYIEKAYEIASMAITRSRTSGTYSLNPSLPDYAIDPGFFRGISGIGYQLLRISDSNSFPSVLLME
jgi:lantibiotic modifying enzyme